MTDAREQIAQMLVAYRTGKNGMLAVETADAILAAMPDIVRGMVKPLVWSKAHDNGTLGMRIFSDTEFGRYAIEWWSSGEAILMPPAGFPNPLSSKDEAKSAANDLNAAHVLKALGLDVKRRLTDG